MNGQLMIFENHGEFVGMRLKKKNLKKSHGASFMAFVLLSSSLHFHKFQQIAQVEQVAMTLAASALFSAKTFLQLEANRNLACPRVSLKYGGEGGVIRLVPLISAIKGQQISISKDGILKEN